MQNFAIHFTYPWLLLLIIPCIGIALIPFFRIEKKYRYTRNRVCSVVLHCIIMLIAVIVLAGINFTYTVANNKNEIILLVDMSDSEEEAQDRRDEFVETVLHDGRYDNFKIGVVTFGFTQEYAVPLTTDVKNIYSQYLASELPDTSATDIAAALTFTKDLFENPETGKIVLVTDGIETDESATSVIRSVAAQGIKVDVAYVHSADVENELQITDVTLPEYHVSENEECTINVTVQSTVDMYVQLNLADNGVVTAGDSTAVEIKKGVQTVEMKHTFSSQGLHELALSATPTSDSIAENNQFHTYIYIEVYNKVLILERNEESTLLDNMLSKDDAFEVTVMNIADEDVPTSVEQLREYDQVILNNIANRDMPEGFDQILYSYVYDYGGGLFTTGGNDESGNANAYNRVDMYGSLYQQMLPVQAINYTPPVGVVVIIDRSGSMSMSMDDGTSYLDWAKAGAANCLDALTERDYFGVMTLESEYGVILDLTPVTQRARILSAIESGILEPTGGTVFTSAIDRAGLALRGLKSVDRKHIVIVTDGEPGDNEEDYLPVVQSFYENDGITVSVVGIGIAEGSDTAETMTTIVETGHGRLYTVTRSQDLSRSMFEDLNAPNIKEVNPETFAPIIYDNLSSLLRDVERAEDSESRRRLTVNLDGFYGVKVRESADLILVGDYDVPVYAQWKYGKGMVGSFMCDVNGTWSNEFMNDSNGQRFLLNVINNLMPVENIRSNEIETTLRCENYINKLSVITGLNDGEYVKGTISFTDEDGEHEISMSEVTQGDLKNLPCYVTVALDASNNYSRCYFVARESGVYTITLVKCDAAGNELAVREIYKNFAYSAEYYISEEDEVVDVSSKLETIASRGHGSVIENLDDPWEIFSDFVTRLSREFDPRILLIVLVILLFLLDIAVRKFKFKWPHELIRAYKEKKNGK